MEKSNKLNRILTQRFSKYIEERDINPDYTEEYFTIGKLMDNILTALYETDQQKDAEESLIYLCNLLNLIFELVDDTKVIDLCGVEILESLLAKKKSRAICESVLSQDARKVYLQLRDGGAFDEPQE